VGLHLQFRRRQSICTQAKVHVGEYVHNKRTAKLRPWQTKSRRIHIFLFMSKQSKSPEKHHENRQQMGMRGYLIRGRFPASVAVWAVTLLASTVFSMPMNAQNAPSIHVGGVELTGIPEDWSSHYVVFSNPGTEQEAIRSGRHEQWLRVVNDPRYVMQQLRTHAPVQGPAAVDVENRLRRDAEAARSDDVNAEPFSPIRIRKRLIPERMPQPEIKRDWSMPLGGASGLAAGHYPAKFGFSPTSASCSDYAIFPTGAAGSNTQATIVAFKNLYIGDTAAGACETTDPTVYWAYNTGNGAIANLSPVLSIDGTQVAFIQITASVASLVILKMADSGGSATSPVTLTSVAAANYRACTAPCFTAIVLNGSPNDTKSAPFYLYDGSDILYVGGSLGKLHKFTGVFNGTPAESTSGGWPAVATAQTGASAALTSPVYDSGGSTLIFVGDAGGYLNSVTTTGTTSQTRLTANRGVCGTAGMVDSPVVDSATEFVYTFAGDGCDGTSTTAGNSYVNRFATGTPLTSSYGANYMSMGNGGAGGTVTTSTNMFRGAFDNLYFAGTGSTGNLYICVQGAVYQLPMATLITSPSGTTPATGTRFSTPVSTPVKDASACSPVTEFLGAKATTTLTAGITTTTSPTTLTLASTTDMADGNYIQIDSEIMLITAVASTTAVTVTRGELGTTATDHAAGAVVTDIQDWLFFSVQGDGNTAGCTGACIYNFNITTGAASGAPTAGLAATGGSSGIIIDNRSTLQLGAQQIYFTMLAGTTAVQASQAGLQ
jgi:hypothetical protein